MSDNQSPTCVSMRTAAPQMDEPCTLGFSRFLQNFSGSASASDGQKASAKAKASSKAKAQPSAPSAPTRAARPKAKSSADAQKPEKAQNLAKPEKPATAEAGNRPDRSRSTRRRSGDPTTANLFSLDMNLGISAEPDALSETMLPEADREVLDIFDQRLSGLQNLEPPLAEDTFRAYCQQGVTDCGKLLTELKSKVRSLNRRAGKESDPLRMKLQDLEKTANALVHLLKCRLAWYYQVC